MSTWDWIVGFFFSNDATRTTVTLTSPTSPVSKLLEGDVLILKSEVSGFGFRLFRKYWDSDFFISKISTKSFLTYVHLSPIYCCYTVTVTVVTFYFALLYFNI
jgi:hypothetical protein